MEYIKILVSVASMMVAVFLTYHRFVMRRIDKKVDQTLHEKEMEWLKVHIEQNYTNLQTRMDGMSKDTKVILEHILNKKQ